jgi:hypothetical protein
LPLLEWSYQLKWPYCPPNAMPTHSSRRRVFDASELRDTRSRAGGPAGSGLVISVAAAQEINLDD